MIVILFEMDHGPVHHLKFEQQADDLVVAQVVEAHRVVIPEAQVRVVEVHQ